MKILIVDDEYLILNELKNAIGWSKLGIDEVLAAYSIEQAKEIIAQNDVNIILCDIELPEGSGLDLLAWVKDNYPDIETLILTCHVDFSYAKQAVNLGCLDYILKPVQYHELEKAIAKAIEKVNAGEKLLKHSSYGDYWLKHMPILIERFWFNIISQSIAPNMKAIMAAAESRDIPFAADMKFLPILIENRRWHKAIDLYDQKVMEFAMKNVAGETIFLQGENGLIVDYGRYNYIAILSCHTDFQNETLRSNCAFFIETCNNFLGCDMNCYVGEPAYADAIPNIVSRLFDMQGNNVVHDNCVLFLNMPNEASNTGKYATPDLKFWEILLNDGYYDEVFAESIKYLGRLSQSALVDATLLRQFDFEFMQMVYSVFKKHNIYYSSLLGSKESISLHDKALHSITDMEAWIASILKEIQSQLKDFNDQAAIVNEVSRIVKRDIYQDISRNEIADIMHMNPDYLDRVFKKETGLSMKKFIVREKVNIAKKLLEETELPITILAVKLGYKNMSHFSSVFKMHTNFNPMDYRKDFKKYAQ